MLLDIEGKKYELEFHHIEDVDWSEYTASEPEYRRATVCIIKTPEGDFLRGDAVCHPPDQFKKVVGRKISFRHTVESLPRDLRSKLWNAYFKATNAKYALKA